MKSAQFPLRFATGLLLAAAALPLIPLGAQETQAPAQAPVDITPPPAPAPQTPPVTDATPAPNPPAAQTAPPAETEEAPAARQSTLRTTARARPRTTVQPRAAAPVRSAAPAPATLGPDPAPVEAVPPSPPVAEFPATAAPAPAPEVLPVETPPAAEPQQDGGGLSPELLAGALALAGLAGLAFLFTRRRRRRFREDSYRSNPTHDEPAVAAAPVAAAAAPAFQRETPAEEIVAAPAAASALGLGGRPWLELQMRPLRAGVGEENACVEFELRVDNQGSAPAEDVRISTFMLAAGPAQQSEMERMMIDPPPAARFPEAIEAGDGKRIATAVALPRNGLQDTILPVVVAEARYRLPDGSEGRTSASFEVGVPWGEGLAHFDVQNPSGLHDGVEARPQGEPQRT